MYENRADQAAANRAEGGMTMIQNALERIRRFLGSEDGPTAVEYAVMLMLIFLAVLSAVQLLGGMTSDSLQQSSDKIIDAVGRSKNP